jgi:hypothetical protein
MAETDQVSPVTTRPDGVVALALRLLREAIKAVPAVRYFLGVVGAAAAASLVGAVFLYSWRVAFIGTVILFLGSIAVVIFANLTKLDHRLFHLPAIVLTWVTILLLTATAIALFTSVFFAKPLDLRRWLLDSETLPTTKTDVESVPPSPGASLKPVDVPQQSSLGDAVPDSNVMGTSVASQQQPTMTPQNDDVISVPQVLARGRVTARHPSHVSLKKSLRASRDQIMRLFMTHKIIPAMVAGEGGMAVVIPKYPLGSDLNVDFVVITAPQWYQVDLLIIGVPTDRPFLPSGDPSPALAQALKRAERSRLRFQETVGTVGRDLGRVVRSQSSQILKFTGAVPDFYYLHPNSLAAGLDRLSFRYGMVTIVMGRRDMYAISEGDARRDYLQANPHVRLITFDLLLETLGPMSLDPRYATHEIAVKLTVDGKPFALRAGASLDEENTFKDEWWTAVKVTSLEGDGQPESRTFIEVFECAIEVNKPGRYTLSFPSLAGFERIPDQTVTVHYNKRTPVVINLRRAPTTTASASRRRQAARASFRASA